MKQKRKEELIAKRKKQRQESLERKRIENTKLTRMIKPKQLKDIKELNCNSIINDKLSKSEMLVVLNNFYELIINSSYLDEIVRMTQQNISETWFDKKIDKNFIIELLNTEKNEIYKNPTENIALRLCYWSNRIAHHIENEIMTGEKKHKMNDIYTKYFLNPEYNYDLSNAINPDTGELYPSIKQKLDDILIKECLTFERINTPEQLHELFYGLNLRNDLWTLKLQALKELIRNVQLNPKSNIKISLLEEKEDVSVLGKSTYRLIIREQNGIAPIIMHCDKEKLEEFLNQNNLKPIHVESDPKIIEFAKSGKVGIHFTLDEENMEIMEYEALENPNIKNLFQMIYKGDEEHERE